MKRKLSIGKHINKIISSELQKIEFTESKWTGVWEFTREVENEEQLVRITKSTIFDNSLRLEIDTTSNNGLSATQVTLRPSLQREYFHSWMTYQDEESLKRVLLEFVHITLNEGMEWLQIMSVPDMQPDDLWVQELAIDHSMKAANFAKEYDLNYSEVACLERLEQIIRKQQETSAVPDGGFIVAASAYYGEFIKRNLGGEWGWEPDCQQPGILKISNKYSLTCCPLRVVCRFWSKPTLESHRLVEEYKFINTLAVN